MANHKFSSAVRQSSFFVSMFLSSILLSCSIPAHSQTFASLFNFNGTNGRGPSFLTQGRDGNLYGTTAAGGAANNGTIFRMTPAGAVSTLFPFTTEGDQPSALVLGTDGNFYGTTSLGGASNQGAVFKFNGGYSLVTNLFYGQSGVSALVEGPDGKFYGTAQGGGVNNWGVVFRTNPTMGTHSTLHSFTSADGLPLAPLTIGLDGALYGTTVNTIFKITASGAYTLLHTFSKSAEGDMPVGALTLGTDGLLYGTTTSFGASGAGSVFTISVSGTFTVVEDINGSGVNGFNPNTLTLGDDGNFYGTMKNGGATGLNEGTIFEREAPGFFATLYNFDGTHGSNPTATVVQHTNGTFYGSTGSGGSNSAGTIFSENTGLRPFVAFVRSYGPVGGTVQILGQGLTSASLVSFNGISATFHVWNDTFVTATVPAGATTGPVTVTTSSGTLESNVSFTVRSM